MNRTKVGKLVTKNGVVALKADKTQDNPEIDAFLKELGNAGAVIPFLAIFPGGGGETITLDGPVTQQMVIDALQRAGPSQRDPPVAEMSRVDTGAVR